MRVAAPAGDDAEFDGRHRQPRCDFRRQPLAALAGEPAIGRKRFQPVGDLRAFVRRRDHDQPVHGDPLLPAVLAGQQIAHDQRAQAVRHEGQGRDALQRLDDALQVVGMRGDAEPCARVIDVGGLVAVAAEPVLQQRKGAGRPSQPVHEHDDMAALSRGRMPPPDAVERVPALLVAAPGAADVVAVQQAAMAAVHVALDAPAAADEDVRPDLLSAERREGQVDELRERPRRLGIVRIGGLAALGAAPDPLQYARANRGAVRGTGDQDASKHGPPSSRPASEAPRDSWR